MRALASESGGVTDRSRSLTPAEAATELLFPWGIQEVSHVRAQAYLRYALNLPQPQRGTALSRLLGLSRYFPRTSLIRVFGRLRPYLRTHLGGYTKPTEPRPTGMPYTTHTLFSTRQPRRR